MSWCAKMWSWAPMARALVEQRAQREQAGSGPCGPTKKRRMSSPSSSASRKLMPMHAMRQACHDHMTPCLESLRMDLEGKKTPQCIIMAKNRSCMSNSLPRAPVLSSVYLPCYQENPKHKRLVCMCWEKIDLSSLPHRITVTTVVFSIHVVQFPSVGPHGSTCRSTPNIRTLTLATRL